MLSRSPVVLAAFIVLGGPSAAASQNGPPDGPPPTLAGTAVLHRGPLRIDTLPILCHDADRPDRGFTTEFGNAEWTPEVDLSIWPTPGASDSLSVRFDDGESTFDRTIPLGPPSTPMFTAAVNLVSWDPGPGVDLIFGADCSVRLSRDD